MVFHLNKVPKKVLVYFLQKNPNFKYIKNKSQEETCEYYFRKRYLVSLGL